MSNFETLITENYYYVDKTRFIELLENESNNIIFFTRPRKFGKSLFLTTLSHYYNVCEADKFDKLFGDLYIGKNPTPLRNSFVMVNLDFSGIDTTNEKRFAESFSGKIQNNVITQMYLYEKHYPDEVKELLSNSDRYSGVKAINMLFDFAAKLGCKAYVIIDEYDHFANDVIALGSNVGDELYRRMTGANSIVRDFYETLKAGTKTVVDRVFMTGITPIMLDDMTSGFNVSNNISKNAQYNELLGFTQEEVDTMIDSLEIKKEQLTIDLKLMYNGYLFHEYAQNQVYNPSMMLYYCDNVMRLGHYASKYVIDDNLKTDYGRLRRLIEPEENRKKIMEIIENNTIGSVVIDKFSLQDLTQNRAFISLLYYMGLLTIDTSTPGKMQLKIPNYSIRTVYWEYLMRMTEDRNADVLVDLSVLADTMYALAYENNPRPFLDYISKNIVTRLSYRDFENFDEKYLKIIILNNLFYGNNYIPISETELTYGYSDVYLQRKKGILPDTATEWIWEIKYVKKADENNNSVIESKRASARKQLEKYRMSHAFKDRTDVRYLIVMFIGKDKFEIEEYLT